MEKRTASPGQLAARPARTRQDASPPPRLPLTRRPFAQAGEGKGDGLWKGRAETRSRRIANARAGGLEHEEEEHDGVEDRQRVVGDRRLPACLR